MATILLLGRTPFALEDWTARLAPYAVTRRVGTDLAEAQAAFQAGPLDRVISSTPLIGARPARDQSCDRHGRGRREVLMTGMSPGPPGMSIAYEQHEELRHG